MTEIVFIRDGSSIWEKAFTEDHLKLKLGEEKALIIRNHLSTKRRIIKFLKKLIRL